jgi:hypothetical protein
MAGRITYVLGPAAMVRGATLQVGVERLPVGEGLLRGEHGLGELRRVFTSGLGRAGLHQQRMSLDGARDVERTAHLEVRAEVIDRADQSGVGEVAGLLVEQPRAVGPTVPELPHDFDELGRACIAVLVRGPLVEVEVVRLVLAGRRDDVPARSPVADVVERGELARQLERLVIRGGRGRDQSDAFGEHRDRRQQRHRLEVIAGAVTHVAAEREIVGEEDRVELRAFCYLCEPRIVARVERVLRPAVRMAPGRLVVARSHQERVEVQLPGHADLQVEKRRSRVSSR